MFPKGWSNSNCLYSRMYVIWYAQDWRGAGLLSIYLCFFIPWTVNNPNFMLPQWYLACSTSRLPNYYKFLGNCWCYFSSCASNFLFTYFRTFKSHYNSSLRSMKSKLQNVNSQYQYVYWKVLTLELLELGAIFLTCWHMRISGVSIPCWRNCAVLLMLS